MGDVIRFGACLCVTGSIRWALYFLGIDWQTEGYKGFAASGCLVLAAGFLWLVTTPNLWTRIQERYDSQ